MNEENLGTPAARAVTAAIAAGLSFAGIAHPGDACEDPDDLRVNRLCYAIGYARDRRTEFAARYGVSTAEYDRMLQSAYGYGYEG